MKTTDQKKELVLEVKNLRKHFVVGTGKNKLVVPAIDDVSFEVYKRESFGLVGESGCGKTTTGRTIMRLYKPTAGYIKLNGVKISSGAAGNLYRIKKLKEKARIELINLDENKKQEYEINKEYQNFVEQKELEKKQAKFLANQQIKTENQKIVDFNKTKYEIKNQYEIDKKTIIFESKKQKEELDDLNKNIELIELKKQFKVLSFSFNKKKRGLKDSSALDKEVIKQRIKTLKEEYDVKFMELQKLIDEKKANKEQKISKEEYNKKNQEILNNKKTLLNDAKENYLKKLAQLIEPNYVEISENKKQIRTNLKLSIQDINNEISENKKQRDLKLANLNKKELTEEQKKEIQEKTNEINQKLAEEIKKEKLEIKESKAIAKSKDIDKLSRKMQMIFQDPISSLNPRMTVGEIISEGLVIQGQKTKAEINEEVKKVLDLVGLSHDYIARYPHEFSGGQRQRIGVARALIMNPDFIIADEPISALDVSIRAQVINLLSELKEKLGLTILFIAHDLSVVRFFCDNIAVMYYGKIVEKAPTEELFRNPIHPYTKSLLSAIPQPDPDYEKDRIRIKYDPTQHDYSVQKPEMKEVRKDHFVLCNDFEFEKYKKELKEKGE